jgi:hypothetical protein
MRARLTFLLCGLLSLSGCTAQAADTEHAIAKREMQAEAARRLPQYFTTCGEDAFSLVLEYDEVRVYQPQRPRLYRLVQYKNLRIDIMDYLPTPAEKLNGRAWKASVLYHGSASRSYERLYREAKGQAPGFYAPSGPAAWAPWRDLGDGHGMTLIKEHGRIVMEGEQPPGSPRTAVPWIVRRSHEARCNNTIAPLARLAGRPAQAGITMNTADTPPTSAWRPKRAMCTLHAPQSHTRGL